MSALRLSAGFAAWAELAAALVNTAPRAGSRAPHCCRASAALFAVWIECTPVARRVAFMLLSEHAA